MADNYFIDPSLYNADKTLKPRHNFDQEAGNNLPPSEGELGYPGDQDQVTHENQTTKSQNSLKAQIFNEYERTIRYITNIIGNVHDPAILDGVEEVVDIGDALRRLFNRVSAAGMQAFTPRLIAMTSGPGVVRSQKTDPSDFTYFGDFPPSYQDPNFFPAQGKQFDMLGAPEPDDPTNPSKYTLYFEQGFGVCDSGVTNPSTNGYYGVDDIPAIWIDVDAAPLEDVAEWDHVTDDYTVPPPVIDGTDGANEVIWTNHGTYLEGKIALTDDCTTWIEEDGVYINGVRYDLLLVEATGGLTTVEGVQKIVNPTEIYHLTDYFEICSGPYAEGHGGTEGGWDRPCHNSRCGIFITTLGPATSPQIDYTGKKYYAYFKRYRPQWYLVQSGLYKDPNTNEDVDGINLVEIENLDELTRSTENIPLYAIYVDHPSRGISKIIDLRKYINYMGYNKTATDEPLEDRVKGLGKTITNAARTMFVLNVTNTPGFTAPVYTLNTMANSWIYAHKNGDEEGFLYMGNLKTLAQHKSTFTITSPGVLTLDSAPSEPLQSGDKIWQPYKDGYFLHGTVTSASGTTVNYNDDNSGITETSKEIIFTRDFSSIELNTVDLVHDGTAYSFYRKGDYLYFPDGMFSSLTGTLTSTDSIIREKDEDGHYTGKVAKVLSWYDTNVDGVDYDVIEIDDGQHFQIDGYAEVVYSHNGLTECLVGEIIDTEKFIDDTYSDGTFIGRESNISVTGENDEYSYKAPYNSGELTPKTRRMLIWKTTLEDAHKNWNPNRFMIAIPLVYERAIWFRDTIVYAEGEEEDGSTITDVPYYEGRIGRHKIILNPDDATLGYAALTGEDIRFHHSHSETIRDFLRDEPGYLLVGNGTSSDPVWDDTILVGRSNRYVGINGPAACRLQIDGLEEIGNGVQFYRNSSLGAQGIHFFSDVTGNTISSTSIAGGTYRKSLIIKTCSDSDDIKIMPRNTLAASFDNDSIVLYQNTHPTVRIGLGGVRINENRRDDINFRIGSYPSEDGLFFDALTGNLGLGLDTPAAGIHMENGRGIQLGTSGTVNLSNFYWKDNLFFSDLGALGPIGTTDTLALAWNWYKKDDGYYSYIKSSPGMAAGIMIDNESLKLLGQDSYTGHESNAPLTRLRMDYTNGDIAIGSDTPLAALHIQREGSLPSKILLEHSDATNDSCIQFSITSPSVDYTMGIDGGDNHFKISFSNTLGTNNAIVIDGSNSRIGIGGTPASNKLEVLDIESDGVGFWRSTRGYGQGVEFLAFDSNRMIFQSAPTNAKNAYIDNTSNTIMYMRSYNGSYYNNIEMSYGSTIINGLDVGTASIGNLYVGNLHFNGLETIIGGPEAVSSAGSVIMKDDYNVYAITNGSTGRVDRFYTYGISSTTVGQAKVALVYNGSSNNVVLVGDGFNSNTYYIAHVDGSDITHLPRYGGLIVGLDSVGTTIATGLVINMVYIGGLIDSTYIQIHLTGGDWEDSSIVQIEIDDGTGPPYHIHDAVVVSAATNSSDRFYFGDIGGNMLTVAPGHSALFYAIGNRWRLLATN